MKLFFVSTGLLFLGVFLSLVGHEWALFAIGFCWLLAEVGYEIWRHSWSES